VPHAHVTIVDTHSQLFGPPGAVVLTPSHDELAEAIAATLTWSWLGACTLPSVAGKARALHLTGLEPFRDTMRRTRTCAAQLADELAAMGHPVRGAEFENHVVLVALPERYPDADPVVRGLRAVNLTTAAAPPGLTGAGPSLRLGTATLAQRQFGASEVRQVAELLDSVLGATRRDGSVDEFVRLSAYDSVRRLLSQFPLPCYVPVTQWEDDR
jgi:glycine/serine hydroxymethyltransferase